MTTYNISNSSPSATESFYKLTPSALRSLYETGLLDASGYVLLLVKSLRAAGWKLTINVAKFCEEWGLSRSSYYRAIARLKKLGLLNLKVERVTEIWHSEGMESSGESVAPTVRNAVPTVGNAVPTVRIETAEVLAVSDAENSPRSDSDLNKLTTNSENKNQSENKNIACCGLEIIEQEKEQEQSQPESSLLDGQGVNEAFNRLRVLNVSLNPTIRKFVQTLNADIVLNAIAHIEERVKARENFKNISGAVVVAFQSMSKPERLMNPPRVYPQPSEAHLEQLQRAKREGSIKFYEASYRGGRTVLVDDLENRRVVTWWEWFGLEYLEPVG